jgi:regulator of replication initiation timing
MTQPTSLSHHRSHARADELALVDRLVRLRHAIAGMAHELGSLRREHAVVKRENESLRRELAELRRAA